MCDFNGLSAKPMRVLVTGSAGAVGNAACRALKGRGHFVRGYDLAATEECVDEAVVGKLCDRELIAEAMQGIDCVVHLAARPADGDFLEQLVPNNIVGLFNVFDLAREQGIGRMVLASSIMAIQGHYAKKQLIGCDALPLAKDHYALAKGWAEAMGEMYCRMHGMDVVVARIGCMPRNKRQFERLDLPKMNPEIAGPHLYLSPGDAGRFFVCAVESECKGYHVFYAVSKAYEEAIFDMEPGREIIGYEPLHRWPEGGDEVGDLPQETWRVRTRR